MSKRDAYVLEILIGQIPKGTNVNIVFRKALGVPGHSQLIKPVRNFLHRGAPTISSSLDRVFSHGSGEFIPTCPGSHASIRRFPLAWPSISGVRRKEHFWLPAISDGSKLIVSHHPGGSQPKPLSEGAAREFRSWHIPAIVCRIV
jgi:hypothetical protein